MKLLLGSAILACILFSSPLLAWPDHGTGTPASSDAADSHYDPQNPFARIIRGELPADKVYEDAHVLAFLSLDQKAPGHVLVISTTSKARDIREISPADLVRITLVAQRVAKAEYIALHADGVVIQQNNGAAAGQTVFHLHVHVVPYWNGTPPSFAQDAQGQLERKAIAARIAAAMRD
ncbi:MAG: HIT family protein [Rhodanobacter sp.]